ncbi:MAG TPA: GlsB/YeaQ/YmgE family stress response membrane protein [Allosphingosinicella sp.]|nr:GlsB/YeaQ/YmgE family stress response membrane protein [Allosphingosinicella sp.]
MGLIVALVVGGVAGCLAGIAARAGPEQPLWTEILIGIVGALLGAFVLGPQLGGGNLLENMFDPMTVVVALMGAALLLGAAKLLRRRAG